MKRSQYFPFVTLLYIIIISVLSQILVYNVTLTNLRISFLSIFWSLILIYNTFIIFVLLKGLSFTNVTITISKYIKLLSYILVVLLISVIFLVIYDLMVIKEINIWAYLKFGTTLFLVSLVVSLIYFLEEGFYKYRILWTIGFVGTIVLAPLLVEAGTFVRDLRFKSLLDFWNWIVPYQAVEQLRQFVLLEGWQGWDVAVGSAVYLIVYWFVVASICLYVRQLQTSWKLPKMLG